jgi:hypothetical protein
MIDGSRTTLRDLRSRKPWVYYIWRNYFLVYDGKELVGTSHDIRDFSLTHISNKGGQIWFEAARKLSSAQRA